VPNFEQMIAQRVQAFVTEITELARQQALETLSAALIAGGRGRLARGRNGTSPTVRLPRRGRDQASNRRSPEEIDRAAQALLSEIQSNPGLRVEQIGRALGAATKDLSLPLKKLLSQRLVRSEGQRRATRYFPAGSSARGGRGKGRGARGRGRRRGGSAAAAAASE
jgi:hypothetical protein